MQKKKRKFLSQKKFQNRHFKDLRIPYTAQLLQGSSESVLSSFVLKTSCDLLGVSLPFHVVKTCLSKANSARIARGTLICFIEGYSDNLRLVEKQHVPAEAAWV
jgi:hypothetical protein